MCIILISFIIIYIPCLLMSFRSEKAVYFFDIRCVTINQVIKGHEKSGSGVSECNHLHFNFIDEIYLYWSLHYKNKNLL